MLLLAPTRLGRGPRMRGRSGVMRCCNTFRSGIFLDAKTTLSCIWGAVSSHLVLCQGGHTCQARVMRVWKLDSGLGALVLLLRFHGVAAEADQLRHQLGVAQVGTADMLRSARAFGLKARMVSSGWRKLSGTPLPAIAALKDGTFVILAKVSDDAALIHDPASGRPLQLAREAFEAQWSGRLLAFDTPRPLFGSRAAVRYLLVHPGDAQVSCPARGSLGGVSLPPGAGADLAFVLPGGDRQGAGAPGTDDARHPCRRPGRGVGIRGAAWGLA